MSSDAAPVQPASASTRSIVIVGAGAAGSLVALHLARAIGPQHDPLEVVLADPAGPLAASAAFGTDDERHLLNVPASGMSALPDEPGHFLTWRNDVLGVPTEPYDFVPRRDFAAYLRACLDDAVAGTPRLRLDKRSAQVVGARVEHAGIGDDDRVGGQVQVDLEDGTRIAAHALVVAPGLGTPSVDWAPPRLVNSPRFLADPWAPGALDAACGPVDGPADVLVVGSGLTMIDIVLSCADAVPNRRIHAVSPSGSLPHLHAPRPLTPLTADISAWGDRLGEVRDRVDTQVRASLAEHDDWRPAIDGLRPWTATLWARMSEADRTEFLATDAGAWNRARHRRPLITAQQLTKLEAAGRFGLAAARVADVEPLDSGGLHVFLDNGTTHEVGWVVNATGPRADVATLGNPLIDDLLAQGLGVPATAGMGFRTVDGRLIDEDGTTTSPIFTLGAMRRGELWESTAVPEIRSQAAQLAQELVAEHVHSSSPSGSG